MYVLKSLHYFSTIRFIILLVIVDVDAAPTAPIAFPIIAEVAMLLNNQTGYYINYDRESSLAEWSAIFRDVTTFFSFINSAQISFRVTSLDVVETETSDMKSIYYAQTTENWEPDLCESYGKTRPEFDIALMICGSKKMEMEAYMSPCKEHTSVLAKGSVPGCKPEELIFTVAAAIGEILMLVVRDKVSHCHSYRPANVEHQTQLIKYFECIMNQYVLYQNAISLNKINSRNSPPVLDPDFDNIIISQSVEEECQQKLNSSDGNIHPPEYSGNANYNKCGKVLCWSNKKEQSMYFVPPENTICDKGKRCFNRRCMEPGSLLINVGTGLCFHGENRFSRSDSPTFAECPRSSLHADRWRVLEITNQNERCNVLVMSYVNEVFKVVQDKYLGVSPINKIFRFEPSNSEKFSRFCWKFDIVENNEFLIVHSGSGTCIKHHNGEPVLSEACDRQDPTVRWKFGVVFPELEDENQNETTANVKLNPSVINSPFNKITLRVNISNVGEAVAVTPGALITWPNSITLVEEPKRCFLMYEQSNHTCYKCKLGRILQQNETAELITLTFVVSNIGNTPNEISFTLTPTVAFGLGNVRNTTIFFRPHIVQPHSVTSQGARGETGDFENWSTSTENHTVKNILPTETRHNNSSTKPLVFKIASLSTSLIAVIILIVCIKLDKTRIMSSSDKFIHKPLISNDTVTCETPV